MILTTGLWEGLDDKRVTAPPTAPVPDTQWSSLNGWEKNYLEQLLRWTQSQQEEEY